MMASAARRAASGPIPPHTSTRLSFSKNLNERPPYSLRLADQSLTSGQTSLSRAATIAILVELGNLVMVSLISYSREGARPQHELYLRITVRPKPFHRTAQRTVHRDHFPAQFPLRLGGRDEHFLPAHLHGLNVCARFAAKDPPRDDLIYHARRQSDRIRHPHLGRWQAGDFRQLIENLFQRQVLPAEDVALAASAFLQRGHMSAGTLGYIYQIQTGIHVCRKLLFQEVHNDATRRGGLDVLLADGSRGIHHDHIHSVRTGALFACIQGDLLRHELGAFVVANHVFERDRRILIRQVAVGSETYRAHT